MSVFDVEYVRFACVDMLASFDRKRFARHFPSPDASRKLVLLKYVTERAKEPKSRFKLPKRVEINKQSSFRRAGPNPVPVDDKQAEAQNSMGHNFFSGRQLDQKS